MMMCCIKYRKGGSKIVRNITSLELYDDGYISLKDNDDGIIESFHTSDVRHFDMIEME